MQAEDPPTRDAFGEALDQAHARVIAEMALARDPDNAEALPDPAEQAKFPAWAKEMRVKGVVYTITTDKAKELG